MSDRAFVYESCDIPAGLTIREWRSARAAKRPPRRRVRHLMRRH